MTTSITSLYWFFRMNKLFRHRLIMLLIFGDVVRSVWYFVFSAYTFTHTVTTSSTFCQASGFFIQYGTETNDYAVLVVAIHSALQIFRPAQRGNSDGLYEYRIYVFLGAFIIPALMATLAFVNAGPAYELLGALCQLPIRPFWYRLALSWIPRYLIGLIILILAGAIYAYVGCEFRSYANLSQSSMTPITTTLGVSLVDADIEAGTVDSPKARSSSLPDSLRMASSMAHDVVSRPRRGSAVIFGATTYVPTQPSTENTPVTKSLPGSSTFLPLARTTSTRPSLSRATSGYAFKPPLSARDVQVPFSPLAQVVEDPMAAIVTENAVVEEGTSRHGSSPPNPHQRQLAHQRRRIHRQLRLMFVYPLVYILMWMIPFVYNCMNYNNYYANHPVFFVRIGQVVCLTSMGFFDSLIFCLREKPWRTIPTSDGTFWGSLAVWRSSSTSSESTRGEHGRGRGRARTRHRSLTESGSNRVARVRNSVRTSASDDHTRRAAQRARKRLDMEKVERLAAMTKKREGVGIAEEKKGKEKMTA
ncbi:G protein-coupled glucose receptor regulating Gpa2 C-term [Pleosporales sp. CAS-2024a]